jgi:hypothetical protein
MINVQNRMMIKCPKCNQTQSTINSPAWLKIWIDLKPRVWNCPKCNSSLSFTPKGILLFWGICFPIAMGISCFLFWDSVENFPPLVAVALIVVLMLTFLISIFLKKQIYKIKIIDKS